MIGLFVLLISMMAGVWVRFRLRSYVMRSGQSPVGPDDWADWHLAREHAVARRDGRGAALARWYVFWNVAAGVGVLLLTLGV